MPPSAARVLLASAPVFAALGDATRLQLVARLSGDGPQSITRLAAGADVTRQAVTKHLRVLEDAGLVRSVRQGRETIWELATDPFDDAHHVLDLISRRWDDALERLRLTVER
jgi:DNA-binding transcriptional ArsR family regulator